MSFMSRAQLKYHEKESFTPEVHRSIDAFTTGWIKMDPFCSVTLNETPVNVVTFSFEVHRKGPDLYKMELL